MMTMIPISRDLRKGFTSDDEENDTHVERSASIHTHRKIFARGILLVMRMMMMPMLRDFAKEICARDL